ncbi:flavin reductase family protein [Desulfothermobacter acidiphilus]|uniref:flavin reductase family protein n=1 Tax=Desulfothermobacter acidiphilus TaxID=1938353 RepID=UPI003F8C5887
MEGKEALRLLPWPVTLIGTCHEGRHNLMTASWVMQVSFRPPLVMVALAPERYTYEILTRNGEFAISILAADQMEIANFCGTHSGREVDKVKALGLKTKAATQIQVPLLEDCVANLECCLVSLHPAGDHVICVGEVVEGSVELKEASPLILLNWQPGVICR